MSSPEPGPGPMLHPQFPGVVEAPSLVTAPDVQDVQTALAALEPLFHLMDEGRSVAELDALLAPDFWEVGASGRRYSRAFVMAVLSERRRQQRQEVWQMTDAHVQALAPDLYLFTYSLVQTERLSRRATLWRTTASGWQAVYHQGTVAG